MTNNGKGTAVTRLIGRLKVIHRKGIIEFELRSPSEIRKRGAKTIVRVHVGAEIPMLEDGMTINVEVVPDRRAYVSMGKVELDDEGDSDRRGDRS